MMLGKTQVRRSVHMICTAAVTIACAAGAAHADTIDVVGNGGPLYLSQSFATTGAGQAATTVTGTGANDGMGSVVGSDLTGNGASTYLFNQSYTNSTGGFSAGTLANGNSYGLVASYVVDLPASTTGDYIFSLNLTSSTGIDNLSSRLYAYGSGVNTTLGITGAPPQGGLVANGWSTSVNGGAVDSTSIAATSVNAGLYVLEVVGQLSSGATSGSYSGQLSVSPVPLPAALPLLLSGFAGLAGFARRRAKFGSQRGLAA